MAGSGGIFTTQYGYGCRTQRGWGRPDLFALSVTQESIKKNVAISFGIIGGGILGKIQNNIQKSIIQSIQFTNDENGCADFKLKLTKNPSFEILPNSIIEISVGTTGINWYKGVINYPELLTLDNESIEYAGYGLRKYLEDLKANTTYLAGTDISAVVADIAQTWIAPYCPITYLAAKIDSPSGVVLAFDIELGKYSIKEIMSTLILMAQTSGYYYIWGVDAEGDFYFTKLSNTALKKTFFVGYNCQTFKPKLNFQDIKNVITVTRKNTGTAIGAGWTVAGVYNNLASYKKYGRQELVYQVPGYFSNSDCDLVGNALINNLAEPNYSATASGIRNWLAEDLLTNGLYRFIMPKKDDLTYTEILNDLDNYTQFTLAGAGDLVLSNDTNIFMWANSGIKFALQNAINQTAVLNITQKGFIQKIKIYFRTNTVDVKIQIGVGITLWNENTTDITLRVIDTFVPFEWDVSMLSLTEINKFGIKILENYVAPVNFWVDRLEVVTSGRKTFKIKLLRATYKYTPDLSEIQAEFGGLPPSLVQYIAGLQKAAAEMKFTNEIT